MSKVVGHLDIDLNVDLDVRTPDGVGQRFGYAVPCRIPVLEGMKTVCRATLGRGGEAEWLGRDGVPLRSLSSVAAKRRGAPVELPRIESADDLACWTRCLSGSDLIRYLPDRHAFTNDRTMSAANARSNPVKWVDGGDGGGFDLSAAAPRVETFRRNAADWLAIQDGELFLARKLPTWHPNHTDGCFDLNANDTAPTISDRRGGVGSHFLATSFACDRIDDVLAFQRIRGMFDGPLRGRLIAIDPEYGPPSALPDAAMAICSWIVTMAKVPVEQLDADLVRHWHQLSNWAVDSRYDVEAARQALVSARTYVDAVKDLPDAFRGRERIVVTEPFYRNCLARMDVEGIRSCFPEDGTAPRAA